MLLQNEDAEELMRQVEQEEEAAAAGDSEGLQLHLCIINLVIGTLYCSKVGIRMIIAGSAPSPPGQSSILALDCNERQGSL